MFADEDWHHAAENVGQTDTLFGRVTYEMMEARRGVSETDIRMIAVENPGRLLTLVEPHP